MVGNGEPRVKWLAFRGEYGEEQGKRWRGARVEVGGTLPVVDSKLR